MPTASKLLAHIAFACAIFGLSATLTYFMIRTVRLLDLPNDRSAHSLPIPKSGGVEMLCVIAMLLAGSFCIGRATAPAR